MATLVHGAQSANLTRPRTGLAALIARIAAWRRARQDFAQTLRDLNEMDPRDLHDLGITHYDFEAIAQGAFKR